MAGHLRQAALEWVGDHNGTGCNVQEPDAPEFTAPSPDIPVPQHLPQPCASRHRKGQDQVITNERDNWLFRGTGMAKRRQQQEGKAECWLVEMDQRRTPGFSSQLFHWLFGGIAAISDFWHLRKGLEQEHVEN